jgi:hypothetical protein
MFKPLLVKVTTSDMIKVNYGYGEKDFWEG